MGIGRKDGLSKWVVVVFKLGKRRGIAGPRQGKAGHDSAIVKFKTGLRQALRRSLKRGCEAFLDPEAYICRASFAFAKYCAGHTAQPRPASCAAAINTQEKELVFHLQAPVWSLI